MRLLKHEALNRDLILKFPGAFLIFNSIYYMEKNKVEWEWVMKNCIGWSNRIPKTEDFGDKMDQNVHVSVQYFIIL